jgi:YD repeat-containing protein
MKNTLILAGMLLLCLQLSAQRKMPPFSLSDNNLKGPVKSVTTYYEDNLNGMPYTTTAHYNRMGYLERRSVNGEMRSGTTSYLFDESGRLVGEEYADFYTAKTTYTYDKKGCIVRAITVSDYTEEDTIEYDTSVFVNHKDCKPQYIMHSSITDTLLYDKSGRLTTITNGYYHVEYTYDAAGNMVEENRNRGESVDRYVFDKDGNVIESWSIQDGIEEKHFHFKYSDKRDPYGNWLQNTVTYQYEGETLADTCSRTIEYYSK